MLLIQANSYSCSTIKLITTYILQLRTYYSDGEGWFCDVAVLDVHHRHIDMGWHSQVHTDCCHGHSGRLCCMQVQHHGHVRILLVELQWCVSMLNPRLEVGGAFVAELLPVVATA